MDRILEPFQYIDAIKNLAPGAKFGIYDNSLDKIDWQDESISQPSDADIEAELVRLQEEYDAQTYARNRKEEYPDLAEQLDMLWHAIDAGTLDDRDHRNKFYSTLKTVKTNNPKG